VYLLPPHTDATMSYNMSSPV